MNRVFDLILIFLLIATSGFQYFYVNEEWIVVGLVLSIIISIKRKILVKIDHKFILLFFVFVGWEFIQLAYFGNFRFVSLLGTSSRLLFAYLVIKNTENVFLGYYVKIINFFAIISLIFYTFFFFPSVTDNLINYALENFQPLFSYESYDYAYKANIIIFNFHGYDFIPFRNSGPFWEPGAFAIFLSLAILFDIIQKNNFILRNNIFLIIALFTTFSTTGYLILALILTWSFYVKGNKNLWYLFLIPICAYYFLNFAMEQEFIYYKIEQDYLMAQETTGSRFGSAFADFTLIKENPVLGYGRNIQNIYGTETFDVQQMHRNNGFTKLFVQWGMLALLYLYQILISFYTVCKSFISSYRVATLVSFIVLLLGASSQGIFQYPLFMGLMFLQFIYHNNKLKTN